MHIMHKVQKYQISIHKKYTTVQNVEVSNFLKKCILYKDILNWSKETLNIFIMLQKIIIIKLQLFIK